MPGKWIEGQTQIFFWIYTNVFSVKTENGFMNKETVCFDIFKKML